jgi:hypothetical protein
MPEQTGSFASMLGGSDALKQAMQRRGIDTSALQSQSPASAGGQSVMPTGVPTTNPQVGSMPEGSMSKPEDTELKIALKALGGFVQSEGKLRRDVVAGQNNGLVV